MDVQNHFVMCTKLDVSLQSLLLRSSFLATFATVYPIQSGP